MKRAVVAVLLAALCAPLVAGADDTKKGKYEVEVVKNVAYKDTDADDVRHKLDLYLPKGAKDYPVFFFIHGGGWTRGSKEGTGKHGKMFAEHGVGFVTINYRLSPKVKSPEHIKDVAQAFAWTMANLGKRGANLDQVYVSGHSAGGHLAALLATNEEYLKAHKLSVANIRGVIPISGVFTISARQEKIFGDEESRKKASPQGHVREKMPPFLVLYADKEIAGLGKQAAAFGQALKKVGAKGEVKMIKDRDHGSIAIKASDRNDEVAQAIFAFIKENGGFGKAKE
jgi:acetyl esterase/lipase